MSIAKGFVVVLISGACFSAAGGLLGLVLGAGAPDYYRGVFERGDSPGFRPVQVGLGLGITQGLACGLLIGSAIVLAAAASRRYGEPDESRKQQTYRPWSAGIRRVFAAAVVVAAVVFSGLVGFMLGAVVVETQSYRRSADARLARIRPVLAEPPFARIEAGATSDGMVDLSGTIGSERDREALLERLRFLFGDEEARSMTRNVEISGPQ